MTTHSSADRLTQRLRLIALGVFVTLFIVALSFPFIFSVQKCSPNDPTSCYQEFNYVLFGQLLSASIAIVGLLLTVTNIELASLKDRLSREKDARRFSYDLVLKYNEGELRKAVEDVAFKIKYDVSPLGEDPERLKEYLDSTSSLFDRTESVKFGNTVGRLLNYFEHLAQCIKKQDASEEIIRFYLEAVIVTYYNRFCAYINLRRTQSNNPSAYIEFERLAKAWMASPAYSA